MLKKSARWATADSKHSVADLEAPGEVVRGHGVRSLCPCHAGWEVFEQHVSDVLRLLGDRNKVVRAHALHVFEDAARMQATEDLSYYLVAGEERIGEKRALGRSMEERLEARRNRKVRKRHKRHRVEDGRVRLH